jgi:DNA-binding transcriptional ArsR family regulator
VTDPTPLDAIFRAVADPTRRALLELLRDADLSVSELARPFRVSQPAISQHLAVLRRAGLVRDRRAGRRRVYRIERGPLERVERWVARQLVARGERRRPKGERRGGEFPAESGDRRAGG